MLIATNINAGPVSARLYYYSVTYSHIHSTFSQGGITGPTGYMGVNGYTGATGATGPTPQAFAFDGGSPTTNYNFGPSFNCGSVV